MSCVCCINTYRLSISTVCFRSTSEALKGLVLHLPGSRCLTELCDLKLVVSVKETQCSVVHSAA